jgi:hypothetical protein
MVALMKGIRRFRCPPGKPAGPHLKASVVHAPEIMETGIELEALHRQLRETVFEVLAMMPNSSKEAARQLRTSRTPFS